MDTRLVLFRSRSGTDVRHWQRRLVGRNGSGVRAERAELCQLRWEDCSWRVEDIPSHVLRAGRRGQRADVGVVAELFRQESFEVDPHVRAVADLLRKIREHRRQSLKAGSLAGSEHHPNDRRLFAGAGAGFELMKDVHFGHRRDTRDGMLAWEVEVKLDKLVGPLALDLDLVDFVVAARSWR